MEILRIDSEKNIDKEIERLEIKVGRRVMTITEDVDGAMRIHRNSGDYLKVIPCCRNEITMF